MLSYLDDPIVPLQLERRRHCGSVTIALGDCASVRPEGANYHVLELASPSERNRPLRVRTGDPPDVGLPVFVVELLATGADKAVACRMNGSP